MDKTDLQILSILRENARTPLKAIAEKVFLSSPATAARIERLEKAGIITSYEAKLDLKKIGLPITAFVKLDLDPKQKPTFYPFVKEHPNILECACITGGFSHLLKVAFESTEALDTFIGEINNYGHTETQIAFSSPKPPTGPGMAAMKTE
ncbi:MAG: Lrp/AsnC family transcriptional regulator [Clostridia bacterium]|nr:Lrp/AsnC family transcriptional regulator [Clostridia bacterium]